MSHDDVLFGYRLRLFTLAEELGNVYEACRRMGVSRQTYYRLKRQTDRWGIEALRVRERRRPRQPNEIGPHRTSTSTSPTTTPTAHTPAATHADASQPRS